jgi:hypothetical protein
MKKGYMIHVILHYFVVLYGQADWWLMHRADNQITITDQALKQSYNLILSEISGNVPPRGRIQVVVSFVHKSLRPKSDTSRMGYLKISITHMSYSF